MLVMLMFAFTLNLPAPQDRTLDLTNMPTATRRFIPAAGRSNVMVSMVTGQQPVGSLGLVLLRADLDHDKSLVYEIRFTNTGSESVCIPNDPNISDVEPLKPEPYTYGGATLSLTVSDSSGGSRALDALALFYDSDHTHCENLARNESLIIRSKTRLASHTDTRPMLTGKLQVRAMWTPFSARVRFLEGQAYEDTSSHQPVVSSNALTVCADNCN
jgi:hypothetical protein